MNEPFELVVIGGIFVTAIKKKQPMRIQLQKDAVACPDRTGFLVFKHAQPFKKITKHLHEHVFFLVAVVFHDSGYFAEMAGQKLLKACFAFRCQFNADFSFILCVMPAADKTVPRQPVQQACNCCFRDI